MCVCLSVCLFMLASVHACMQNHQDSKFSFWKIKLFFPSLSIFFRAQEAAALAGMARNCFGCGTYSAGNSIICYLLSAQEVNCQVQSLNLSNDIISAQF